LDTGIWLGGLGYGGFGWNNPYGYNNFMVVKDITETTPTMQVEEVQLTPMITRIGILVLETTTITTKLIEDYGRNSNNSSRNNNYNDQINRLR
jgi:hypothetical protein